MFCAYYAVCGGSVGRMYLYDSGGVIYVCFADGVCVYVYGGVYYVCGVYGRCGRMWSVWMGWYASMHILPHCGSISIDCFFDEVVGLHIYMCVYRVAGRLM